LEKSRLVWLLPARLVWPALRPELPISTKRVP
jgi:hypothetical protein